MSDVIKAIPTVFNGVQYKSRLEARFAEWLWNSGVTQIEYERLLPDSSQQYRPDFYLEEFNLYVEVKPAVFAHELDIFSDDVRDSQHPWICVDRCNRSNWKINSVNIALFDGFSFQFPLPCRFEIQQWEHDPESHIFRVYPEYMDLGLAHIHGYGKEILVAL